MPAIRTSEELGLLIRSRRKEKGLDQAQLAERIGATRQWIIDIEKGKPRAALTLVIKTLHALDLTFSIDPNEKPRTAYASSEKTRADSVAAIFSRLDSSTSIHSASVLDSLRRRVSVRSAPTIEKLSPAKGTVSVATGPHRKKKAT